MSIECFLLEPVPGLSRHWLRRYSKDYTCSGSYHDARELIGDAPDDAIQEPPHDAESGWPTRCAHCGYEFKADDVWQLFNHQLYRRAGERVSEMTTLQEAEPGAMWIATWMDDHLIVKLPGGHDWDVDSRASNCTRPGDNVHRCWVRHGEPPLVTVDKNDDTCRAGAGSIQVPGWHGYLRNGELTTA